MVGSDGMFAGPMMWGGRFFGFLVLLLLVLGIVAVDKVFVKLKTLPCFTFGVPVFKPVQR